MSVVKDNISPGLGARCWRSGLAAAGMCDSRLKLLLTHNC